jgi:adenylate kinase
MRLVLLGAPGSGKGTQGEVLARRFHVPHVSSGELLRAQIALGSVLGQQAAEYLGRGDLVPDDVVLAVVADAMVVAAKVGGYVLDGFPRTVAQAERAYKLEPPAGFVVDAVIYLAMPDELARQRLAGRVSQGRRDDVDAVVVERRLAVYHELTSPLLAFYAERELLLTVDAAASVEAVSEQILTALADQAR